jgi:outer membrane protein OmpA-like peptidoglycan-associated protein
MKCNPRKWLLWAPLAALPLLAAYWLNSDGLERRLAQTSGANLATIKADWAKLSFDGRDALLEGNAPGRKAIDDAVKAVAGTAGVRRVDATSAKVVLAPPTITSVVTNNNRPEIRGTWPESFAKTLSVILPDRGFVLGKDPELKSDGAGNWSIVPAEPLKDGTYDVAVEVDDGSGATAKTAEPGKITIDTVAPLVPVFTPITGFVSPQSLSGSWAEGDASTLKVGLAGKTHVLGSDPALTSSQGNWTLTLPDPLPKGVHDLTVEAIDPAGNSAKLNMPAAITISTEIPRPTVAKYSGNDSTPLISGTWSAGQSRKLSIAIGGKTYELGRDSNLSSDGLGNWRLDIASPLKDGIYDAVVTVTDGDGGVAKDETVAEIEIDATGPAVPVVNPATALPVTGTYAPRDTKILRVTLAGQSYTLGKDAALTATGENWSLQPTAELAAGTYDAIVEAVDAFGNVSADASKDELVIAAPPPAPPPSPPPASVPPPTVTEQDSLMARPILTGSWAEGTAKSLKVMVAGSSYVFGTNEELTSSSGQWSLKLPSPLKDGIYDVAVETADTAGNVVTDTTTNELVVDAEGPAAPTVKFYSASESPTAISGTWSASEAVDLTVTLNGKTAKLGKNASLASDTTGNWSLAVADKLAPGSYDVAVIATDIHERSSSDQTRFEILVKDASEPPPTPPTPPPPTQPAAANCATDLAKTLLARPLHFERDKTAVTPDAALVIKDLAAIAASCPADRLEVGGHTDNIGSDAYNQALSERRAVAVAHTLADFGIARDRLSAIGYGETVPVAGNQTEAGRALNRRIEIRIVK